MAPFALDVRYGPRKFRIACRGPTTVARAKRAISRRVRCDAATLRTAERALDDAEVIESAMTLVRVDSRSKLPPTCAAHRCGDGGSTERVCVDIPVDFVAGGTCAPVNGSGGIGADCVSC